jgi:hypothetical protein
VAAQAIKRTAGFNRAAIQHLCDIDAPRRRAPLNVLAVRFAAAA